KYIHYYNHTRIKVKLGGLSPVEYRARSAAA
ncbi:IS3 family transposase, partial [Pseudomonas cedrina]